MNTRNRNQAAALTARPEQVTAILSHQLDMLWDDASSAHHVAPLMLWGPPGIGKSSLVADACRKKGIELIDIRLAQRDPVDLRGLPVPKEDRVDWLLSSDWPRDPDSRGIILFDELTAVDRSLQVAVYELILDRRLGDLYQVPDGWLMVAAGNRGEDRAVSTMMSSALANRFCHVEVEPDLEDWLRWAGGAEIHPDVTGFLRFSPENFHDMDVDLERGWPSARSWERVSRLVERGAIDEASLELMICGLVGVGAGRAFMAFRDWASKLPDIQQLLMNPDEFDLPKRADQRFALCSAMVYYLARADHETFDRCLDGFMEIGLKLPSDFAAMVMTDALTRPANDRRPLDRLILHDRMPAWRRKHGHAFSLEEHAA
ncbi:hypothetical protein HFP89_08155 [Wenzhouxiangella sp. XN79A]|uniref:hypothetical protein n=1 Tax=Wenzhouxiangella sp. XN79A TaxID=2724193 RepID=UPI00144AAA7C|nr:hypothetical protein [Wenzhouxiangella sp. XN79A]NKI35137.1 hypothetical protein [Wenzhouxiangella sp. XN79A]